jgi:type VI secretion system secreted protein Hcp
MANVDYYLKLKLKKGGPVDGEAKAKGHDKEIDILSWSWGEVNSGNAPGLGGQGAGRVNMQDLHCTALMSKASSKLMLACATGDPVTEAILSCRKAGGAQEDFLKITLTDGLVSSYQTGGSGGNDVVPIDQFSLNFTKIKIEYKTQGTDGSMSAGGDATFDLSTVDAS